jgi:hypothetical protein
MNYVPIQFYNENVFEFDGFVKDFERPSYHNPVIKPSVHNWLAENVGEAHYEVGVNRSDTRTWRGAVLLSRHTDLSVGSSMPLFGTYAKEYRFIFANPDKALLFKLTFG